MATDNLKDFQFNLKNFGEKMVPQAHAALVRKIAFEVFKRIVEKTPVDTGRARANWGVEVGPAAPLFQPRPGTINVAPDGTAIKRNKGETTIEVDRDGTATIRTGLEAIYSADPAKQIIWLMNNLPYIEALEDGHSQQAPAGMVEGSLNEIQHFINQINAKDLEKSGSI